MTARGRLGPHPSAALVAVVVALAGACSGSDESNNAARRRERRAAPSYDAKKEFVRTELQPTSSYPFADATAPAGLFEKPTRSWGSAWSDYDGDGDADLFVGRHGAPPHLFRNEGSTFTRLDLPHDFYPKVVDRHACAWGEATGDGRPDLYCTQGVLRPSQRTGLGRKEPTTAGGDGLGPNQLLVQGDRGFSDAAGAYGVDDELGRGRTANWLDYDSDGDLDIFVGNKGLDAPASAMFRNDGGSFTRVDVGLGNPHSVISSSWADWDVDGDPDLLLAQYDPSPTVAYENRDGRFVTVELAHVTGRVWSSGVWGDYDNDGRPDLHVVGRRRNLVLRNTSTGFVVEHTGTTTEGRTSTWIDLENDGDLDLFVVQGAASEDPSPTVANEPDFVVVNRGDHFVTLGEQTLTGPTTGNGDSVAAADYDRDGRMDLYVTNAYAHFKGPKLLYRNLTRERDWVGIDLRGTATNPLGVGAHVIVTSGDRVLHRFVTDEAAFRQQNEVGYLSVGIGRAEEIRVEVRWPDGTRDCLEAPARAVIDVRRGTSPCAPVAD